MDVTHTTFAFVRVDLTRRGPHTIIADVNVRILSTSNPNEPSDTISKRHGTSIPDYNRDSGVPPKRLERPVEFPVARRPPSLLHESLVTNATLVCGRTTSTLHRFHNIASVNVQTTDSIQGASMFDDSNAYRTVPGRVHQSICRVEGSSVV